MYSEGPPGGPCEPFFVQIKRPGQSNRIREHTGNLSAEARKECFFPLSVKIRGFSFLLCQVFSANAAVSRGMTERIHVDVLLTHGALES